MKTSFFAITIGFLLLGVVDDGQAACGPSFHVGVTTVNGVAARFPVAVVEPGGGVIVSLQYVIANSESCSNCRRQIVIGLANHAGFCAYDDYPEVCSFSRTIGSYRGTFAAPTVPGRYVIYAQDLHSSECTGAKALYPDGAYSNIEAIGEIIVLNK